MSTAITSDIVCHIFKQLPIGDQYDMAADVFCDDNEFMQEFVDRKEYMDTIVSKVYDDIDFGDNWIKKFGKNLESSQSSQSSNDDSNLFIMCKTKILGLPESGVPNQGIHKIPVWMEMKAAGLVSDYYLRIIKLIVTPLEVFQVYLTVTNVPNTSEFMATLELLVWSNDMWEHDIIQGVKDIRFTDTSGPKDLWMGQGAILESRLQRNFEESLQGELYEFEDGSTMLINGTFENYKIGFDADVLKKLLW